MHNLGTRLAAFAKGERGTSLMEPLIAVPLLIAVMTAGAVFSLGIMKGQAEAQNRNQLQRAAQGPLDQVVREMRSASAIDYLAPNVVPITTSNPAYFGILQTVLGVQFGYSTTANCATPSGYCVGETNRVLARDVFVPGFAAARRDVLYGCNYQAIYFFAYPRCFKIYSTAAPGAAALRITNPDAIANPDTLGAGYECRLIYPSVGATGRRSAAAVGAKSCDVVRNNAVVAEGGANPSVFAANDWVWTTLAPGIFQFKSNGVPAVPTANAQVKHLELHPTVCNREPYCSQSGFRRPLRLDASVTPRNSRGLALPNVCFDADPTNDPPASEGGCD